MIVGGIMKARVICVASFLLLGLLAPVGLAQDKPKADEKPKNEVQITPLKVTVVFNEYDGEKKLSSLPYTLFLKAGTERNRYYGNMRMGVRVPIGVGGKDSQIQYQDVGSNVDCETFSAEDGRYVLDMRLERSSIYASKDEHSTDQKREEQSYANAPIVRQFRASLALVLRDGQTMQSTVATDPLNGHTVRVDVTLNVLK